MSGEVISAGRIGVTDHRSVVPTPSISTQPIGLLFTGGTAIPSGTTATLLDEELLADRTANMLEGTRLCLDHLFKEVFQRLLCGVILLKSECLGQAMTEAGHFLLSEIELHCDSFRGDKTPALGLSRSCGTEI